MYNIIILLIVVVVVVHNVPLLLLFTGRLLRRRRIIINGVVVVVRHVVVVVVRHRQVVVDVNWQRMIGLWIHMYRRGPVQVRQFVRIMCEDGHARHESNDLCGNQSVCRVHRQFFTKSFLGDDAAVLLNRSVSDRTATPSY